MNINIIGRMIYALSIFTYFFACTGIIYFLQMLKYNPLFIALFAALCMFGIYALGYFKNEVKEFLS